MSSKQHRQQAIARLISTRPVSSQPELRRLLEEKRIVATQVTISRDLEELGAVKVRASGGKWRYSMPEYESDRIAPSDQLRRVVSEWVGEVSHSGNLVIIRTPPGCAHVVASALDRGALPGLMGTVAGDDTILCVATESMGGKRLAASLRKMAGIAPLPKEKK